ncbi:hypothetical protein F2Q68_00014837 [Brassica cretica]|uniref:Uncharacterized protein n=1 Tax=Brassica cretica TaxID=69181 RepID=A0A8S9HGX9_BRACR|nr:hypothetical protein F2Q68_00014837 [Brassica cretica]
MSRHVFITPRSESWIGHGEADGYKSTSLKPSPFHQITSLYREIVVTSPHYCVVNMCFSYHQTALFMAWRFDGDSLPLRGFHRRNGESSIGGARRRRKTATFLSVALLDLGKRRETAVTSLSIGGSLTRSIPDTVAAELNQKWD